MYRTHSVVRGALLLGATAVIAACTSDATVIGPKPSNVLFTNYVALGNSITGGWQSYGINDSTQRQSFPALLAQQMGTRFAFPSFNKPGCPPPMGNWVSQKLIDSLSPVPGGCAFRGGITDVINDVGVPGAYAADLLKPSGAIIPSPLPQFMLGGLSQVDRALAADPTFATVWIGNNEILTPATLGELQPPGYPPLIPTSTFIPAYSAAINKLMSAPHLKGGVLIGAVKVTSAPRFFSADSLAVNPARKADFDFITGKTNTIVGCGISGDLISGEVIGQIRSGAYPPVISCVKNVPAAPLGDLFILDPQEIAALNATSDAYNAYIKAKADSIGFAFWDPNPALVSLRQSAGLASTITIFPNLRSSTVPFGTYVSLDGVHPARLAQIAIANALIDVINAKYGTSLVKIQ